MNIFQKILYFLQGEMTEPQAFGWYHIMWLCFIFVAIFILYKNRKSHNEKRLKWMLGTYGIIAFILEVLKELIWSFNYDQITNIITWDYPWDSFPFQLCTTPIYITIICLFLKKGKLREYLLSYMAYITILGSIATMIVPDDCFVSDIVVNIHTSWMHYGSFVISVYLLMSREIKINLNSVKKASIVFLIFLLIALTMNITIYNLDILGGKTFNMFYISPYFISALPIFDIIQENVPYIIFLLTYIIVIIWGGILIYAVANLIKKYLKKIK
jgi:hypothetical protein